MKRWLIFLMALVLSVAFGLMGCSEKPQAQRLVTTLEVETGDWAMLSKYPFLKGEPNTLEVKGLGLQTKTISENTQIYNYLGKGKWRLETLKKGTEVLSDSSGRPWYKASCGNRLYVPIVCKHSWLPGTAKEPGLVPPGNHWGLLGLWNFPWWLPFLFLLLLPLLWWLGRRRGERDRGIREVRRQEIIDRLRREGGGGPTPGRPSSGGPASTAVGARGSRVTEVRPPVTTGAAVPSTAAPDAGTEQAPPPETGAATATAATPILGEERPNKRLSVSFGQDGSVHLYGQEFARIDLMINPKGRFYIDSTPKK